MRLFGFNAEKKLKKAEEFLAKGIDYEARLAFEEIILRDDVGAPILAQAKEGWRTARDRLMRSQIEEAKRLVQAGEAGEARECCQAAIEQAGNDLDAGEARQLLERIDQGLTEAAKLLEGLDEIPTAVRQPKEEVGEEEEVASGPDALFEVLLQPLPEEQAEAYRGFGSDFRDGFLHLQEGRAEEALSCFDRLPGETARHPLVQLERAQAWMHAEVNDKALETLEGLEIPEDVRRRVQEMKVVLLQRLERGTEAEAEARAIWQGSGGEADAAALYAETLLRNQKPQEALDVIEPFHTPRPDPEVDSLVVRAYLGTGKGQEARDLLEATVEGFFQNPGGLHARFPLWAARELLGLYVGVGEEPKRVRSLVQHLISQDPESAERYKEILAAYAKKRGKGEG